MKKTLSIIALIVLILISGCRALPISNIIQDTSSDPYNYGQWYLKNISWIDAINLTNNLTKSKTLIAIIDNGINADCEELKDKVILRKSFLSNDLEIQNTSEKSFSHATFLASMIGAKNDNNLGISGIIGDNRELSPIYYGY